MTDEITASNTVLIEGLTTQASASRLAYLLGENNLRTVQRPPYDSTVRPLWEVLAELAGDDPTIAE